MVTSIVWAIADPLRIKYTLLPAEGPTKPTSIIATQAYNTYEWGG